MGTLQVGLLARLRSLDVRRGEFVGIPLGWMIAWVAAAIAIASLIIYIPHVHAF